MFHHSRRMYALEKVFYNCCESEIWGGGGGGGGGMLVFRFKIATGWGPHFELLMEDIIILL